MSPPVVSPTLTYAFYGLIAWGLSGLFVAFRMLADNDVKSGIWMRVGVLTWMGVPAYLSYKGFLFDTTNTPPNMMRTILPMALVVVAFCLSPWGKRVAEKLPATYLVGMQGFRLPLELVLYGLAVDQLLPQEMTFGGYNFDIVTGALALGLWIPLHKQMVPSSLLWAFNCLGVALLVTIVSIAVLSFPAPFGLFKPPNLIVAFYPWVWLPTFLVPIALAGHLLLFRKLMLPPPPPSENV